MNAIDFTNHQKLQLVGFVKNNPDIIYENKNVKKLPCTEIFKIYTRIEPKI